MSVESLRDSIASLLRKLAAFLALAAVLSTPAMAESPRVTRLDVEDEVMCVTCNVPLNIAESPQADRQRAFIDRQIEQGKTKEQVKDALVAEYGKDVLGLPDEEGFGITAYAIPAGLIVLLIGGIIYLVPRWKHRGGGSGPDLSGSPALSSTEARRLDEELARYDA